MLIFGYQNLNMKKRTLLLSALLVVLLVMVGQVTNAQVAGGGPPGDPSGGDPPCWPPPCIPIDGGLGVLLAAGAIFGGKKIYDASKENETKS